MLASVLNRALRRNAGTVGAVAGGAGIALRGSAKGHSSGSNSSVTDAMDTLDGSVFVVWATWGSVRTFASIVDSESNTWVEIGAEINNGLKMRGWYSSTTNGGAGHTVTVSTDAGNMGGTVFMLEITGQAASAFDDTSDVDAAAFTADTGTFAQADNLFVMCGGGNTGSNPTTHTITSPTGMAIAKEETDGATWWAGFVATKVISATTALTGTFTQSGGTTGGIKLFAIKQA